MSELARRAAATSKTIEKYRNRPFDWKTRATCIHLARTQMVNMGHRPPRIPDFRSAIGAMTALRQTGHSTLESLLDSLLVRITPAAMWLGDFALLEGEPPFDGMAIWSGGKMLGWHEDDPSGLKPMIAHEIKAAWRV